MISQTEQIKQRLDLVDVIQSYVKLQKAGANYKACCPFHSEKTPSFFVSPSRNIWHCFGGCGKGGDIFSFIMEIEKCDFPEALKILAQRSGVELKKEDPRIRSERNRLLNLLEDTKNFYKNHLAGCNDVLNYLIQERGLKKETIAAFELGYAPDDWRALYNFLRSKNYADLEIEKTGLVIKKTTDYRLPTTDRKNEIAVDGSRSAVSGYYDRFRNRIIFPVNDLSGRTVGFGGRIFGRTTDYRLQTTDRKNEIAVDSSRSAASKYINSPQTIIYDKSRVLYGFDKAKMEISRQDSCVLVEGYMDAIMSHQAGIKNAVAISGTALTPHHIQFISRLTKNIITGFDTDEAGRAATDRSIDLLFSHDFNLKVINLKEEKDPADLIRKNPALWEEILKRAAPVIAFYLEHLEKKCGDDKMRFISEIRKHIFPRLAQITSEMEKSFWIKKIAKATESLEEAIWRELKNVKKQSLNSAEFSNSDMPYPNSDMAYPKTRRERLEKRIIGLLLLGCSNTPASKGGLMKIVETNLNLFSEKNLSVLQDISLTDKFLKLPQEYEAIVLETEFIYNLKISEMEAELQNLVYNLKREKTKEDLKFLTAEIKKINDRDKNNPILLSKMEEFNKLSKELTN